MNPKATSTTKEVEGDAFAEEVHRTIGVILPLLYIGGLILAAMGQVVPSE
jgi:hypothetical protein